MNDLLYELQETLSHEIPITRHLGIRVVSYDNGSLVLKAPLEQNINHAGTAFAGSLNALVTLSAWGQLWLVLKELNLLATIVIQDSTSSYLLPVSNDFSAICHKPERAQIARLEQSLIRKGKARIELCAQIYNHHEIAMSFKGRYVVSSNHIE
jgi:thioesterase domain-containing protein